MGLPQDRAEPAEPVAIVAQLVAPAPAQAPVGSAPKPRSPQKPAIAPASAPTPQVVEEQAPEATAIPAEAVAEAPVVVAEEAAVEEAAAAPPAAPLPREYRASVPPSSELALELERMDAKGTVWHGVAGMSWQLNGDSYTMKFDAGISMIVTKVNLLALASEGSIGENGFLPQVATEKRRGRALTATHFNREQGSITFSASQNAAELVPGAQDKATLPLQLAAIARADPAQFEGGIDITVGEERDAAVYRFTVAGQEEIETKLGRLQTWRLSRPPKPGSYNSRLEVWLAPEHGWYPVRIRNTEASGAVTTQTVTHIEVRDTGTAYVQ
jgi:hypothetical protein